MAIEKDYHGVVLPVDDTKAFHNQMRSVSGMSQRLEVEVDGVLLKVRALHVYTHHKGGEFGTLVLDFLTKTKRKVAVKAKAKLKIAVKTTSWLAKAKTGKGK